MTPRKKLVGSGIDSREKKNCDKPMVLLNQTGMTQDGTTQWKATMGDPVLPNKTKALNSWGVSPVRASKRNASTSEQDSLEKATKLKARKNMDTPSLKGNENQPESFIFADDSSLLASTSALGISFGVNEQEISASLDSLRDLESHRLAENFASPLENNNLDDATTVCSLDDNIDLETLNLICADISEDLGDGGCDPSCLQTPISQLKKSRSRNNKNKVQNCSR